MPVIAFIGSQLLPADLHGEIGLPVGDDCIGGVGILDDEIAGVAGQAEVIHLSLRSRTDIDHCEDLLNMVRHGLATVTTSLFRTIDYR